MRKLLFTMHLYVALVAGVFVIVLGVTGSIMAFETELGHILHPKLWYVTPQPHALSLAGISGAVSKAFPGEAIAAYSISTSPNISYQVSLRRGQVYVNQYTGEILGVRTPGPDFLANVHQLHLRLLIKNKADTGQTIVSWAGVAMLFLLLSGLYLWWPLKRASIAWGSSGRRVWFDVHNAVGICSVAFLLILTITSLMIGFERTTVPMLHRMAGSEPEKPPSAPPAPPGAKAITPDEAVEIARAALPGAAPFSVNVPGPKGIYRVASRFPEDLTGGGRSRVWVDQYSGRVLQAESSRTGPAGTRLVNSNRAIHTGDIFGMPTKVLMSLASLAAVLQVVSGFAMWWKRTRRRRAAARIVESGRVPA